MRFTGGEPLVRRGFVDIVARAAPTLEPRPQLSVTTNALGLARTARRPGRRRASTGSTSASTPCGPRPSRSSPCATGSHDVVAGLEAADEAGLRPVKVNAVLMRGVNDDQAPELLRWCLDRGYELRFIEQMPLDAQHGWRRDEMVTADEILASLEAEFDLDAGRGAAGERPGGAVRASTAARRRSA